MEKLFDFGELLIKILVRAKMKETVAENYTDLAEMLKSFGVDAFQVRKMEREFQSISDDIAGSCKSVLQSMNITDMQQDRILSAVIKAYEKLYIDYERFFELMNDKDQLKFMLLECGEAEAKGMDTREREIYERLLDFTAYLIIRTIVKFPDFTANGIRFLTNRMEKLRDEINEVLLKLNNVHEAVRVVPGENARIFEQEYRNRIINKNGSVRLLGAGGLEWEYREYSLSIAYVTLVFADGRGEEVDVANLFHESKNVWISGKAGTGKTTFLQWLAINVASNESSIECVNKEIPVLIKLREVKEELGVRSVIAQVMKDSSYEMPQGWWEKAVETGKILFLIDGFDEVEAARREDVLRWLHEVDPQRRCKKVFTSRPQVKERPQGHFTEMQIKKMDILHINQFVDYWHCAVLTNQLEYEEKEVEEIADRLKQKIQMVRPLRTLASTPLLCAMLCALHHKNGMNLPSDKRELYEECCKMLIYRRDEEKELKIKPLPMGYEQRKLILAKMAYWMMKNNDSTISKEQAIRVIGRSMEGMNRDESSNSAEEVTEYLLKRCGVLHEPQSGMFEFVHRTFQEYLTACAIVREEDWGYLAEKVGDDSWQETISLAIGFAKQDRTDMILRKTIEKGKKEREEKKYLFYAITYISGAVEVDGELRNTIKAKLSEMIPPELDQCSQIAETGKIAILHLMNRSEYSEKERLACLRTLRFIGRSECLEAVKTYLDQMLTEDEVKEIGGLLEELSVEEQRYTSMPQALIQYIRDFGQNSLVLHSSFISLLNCLNEEDSKAASLIMPEQLKIIDYKDNIICTYTSMMSHVKRLTIQGKYDEVDILHNTRQLEELCLISDSEEFSIYQLRQYKEITNIKQFTLLWLGADYINGVDLDFLHACETLELIPMNADAELYFEKFEMLDSLSVLKIRGDIIDISFWYELKIPLKELVIYADWDLKDLAETAAYEVRIPDLVVRAECLKKRVKELGNVQQFYGGGGERYRE